MMNTTAYTLVPSPEHTFRGHPENPARFKYFERIPSLSFASQLNKVESMSISSDILEYVHPMTYLSFIEDSARQGPKFVDYGDTYITPGSFSAARVAAGGLLAVLDTVINGYAQNGFALIRPPGHHATPDQAMGFCLFNNIAVGARYLQQNGWRKVMIVDFDVHHGNGTQDIFYRSGDVLYLSTHQWGIYPGTGHLQESGDEGGAGLTINIPLTAGAGDAAFREILNCIIAPAAIRFSPDFILVSAGFDAHWSDPLASLRLSTTGYYELARGLGNIASEVCGGRIVYTLEGGYDPEALSDNVIAVFHALAGHPAPMDRLGPYPGNEADVTSILDTVIDLHGL